MKEFLASGVGNDRFAPKERMTAQTVIPLIVIEDPVAAEDMTSPAVKKIGE